MTTQADRIRQFVLDRYVNPARAKGQSTITVRAGDVHDAMRLSNRMPAVCSALDSKKFEELAGVQTVRRTGPPQGANVYFQFSLANPTSLAPRAITTSPQSFSRWAMGHVKRIISRNGMDQNEQRSAAAPAAKIQADDHLDLANALVLISCVKSKLPHPAPARFLYTSAWFRKARDLVEASGARWFVLSALYGLVAPDTEIAPYDHTLNMLGVAARRDWAHKVLEKLLPQIADERRIVMFAGQRYREFLVGPLERRGIKVEVPMEHLARGEQLAWLSDFE
jgi:hypothetical protein